MRKLAMLILFLLCCAMPIHAQTMTAEEAYQEALRRIEEARVSGFYSLDLSELGLRELPPEIGTLSQLYQLFLDENQLQTLPPEIGNLTQLSELYLGKNQLQTLPPEIGNLQNLRWLNLHDNHLRSLPPEIGNLNNLWLLRLGRNPQLTQLPLELAQLPNLKALILTMNEYTTLPKEVFELENLLYLDVSYNQLSSLPPDIARLSRLCGLDLEKNQLRSLPTELAQLLNMEQAGCIPRIEGFDDYNRYFLGHEMLNVTNNPLVFPPPDIVQQGTPAILAYLRDYEAQMVRQTIVGIAAGVGGIALVMLAFRWRQKHSTPKKKREAA